MPKKVVDFSNEEDSARPRSSRRAPKGHFVVYVGDEMTRFVVPTSFLKNTIFQELLDKAAEEYGHNNRIVLPCDEYSFRNLVSSLANYQPNVNVT